jgi:hypothetical protein
MLVVKLLALEIGALLIYAGVTGLSVGSLLQGDNTKTSKGGSITTATAAGAAS